MQINNSYFSEALGLIQRDCDAIVDVNCVDNLMHLHTMQQGLMRHTITAFLFFSFQVCC